MPDINITNSMRAFFCFFILFILTGCKSPPAREVNTQKNTSKANVKYNAITPGDTDTINISTISTDTIYYTKAQIDTFLRFYPELKVETAQRPDILYEKRGFESKYEQDDKNFVNFGSEQGRDAYYAIYAHFLSLRNGTDKYAARRIKLIKLYRDINDIFGRLARGGTYFGHQYTRILGYAEYSVYLYNWSQEFHDYDKPYKIDKQKSLYINSLKQYITDELDNSYEFTSKEKRDVKTELFETVKEIEGLLTEYFYLERAQEFQHSNY